MSNKKNPTKADRFHALLDIPAVADSPELVDFINHELELLARKNSAERKPTAKQTAKLTHDAELRTAIVDEMEMGTLYSAAEMIKSLPTLAAEPDLTTAKVSSLMRALVADGSVVRVEDKRHIFYKLSD